MWIFIENRIPHIVVIPIASTHKVHYFPVARGSLFTHVFSRNVRGVAVLWTGWSENAAVRLYLTENLELQMLSTER